jgi:hypothetical protein
VSRQRIARIQVLECLLLLCLYAIVEKPGAAISHAHFGAASALQPHVPTLAAVQAEPPKHFYGPPPVSPRGSPSPARWQTVGFDVDKSAFDRRRSRWRSDDSSHVGSLGQRYGQTI